MTVESRAAYRYAKSMLDIARERGEVDAMRDDFQTLEQAIDNSRELKNLLRRPTLAAETKGKLLKSIFEGKVSPTMILFLELMAKKGRADLVEPTTVSFRRQLDIERGVERAVITSAHPLNDALKSSIIGRLATLTSHTIEATYEIDTDLIGGFVARVGDRMIDASVRHQLERLQDTLAADAGTWVPAL